MSQLTNTSINTNNRKPKQKKIKMSLAEFHNIISKNNITKFESNEQSNEQVTEQVTDQVTEQVTEQSHEQVNEQVTKHVRFVESKPLVNYWEERKKKTTQSLQIIEPSSNIFNEEINKINDEIIKLNDEIIKLSEKKTSDEEINLINEDPELKDDDFVEVKSKNKYNNKQSNNQIQVNNKQVNTMNILKVKALEVTHQFMIDKCINILTKINIKSTHYNLIYMEKYRKIFEIDITDDKLVTENNGINFEFSQIKFLRDRSFRYDVRERFAKIIPVAWVSFFESFNEGKFCLSITKRNN
jgi:hypothetical protein